jgi:hypothetical protein
LFFTTEVESVYCAVCTESLYEADYISSLKSSTKQNDDKDDDNNDEDDDDNNNNNNNNTNNNTNHNNNNNKQLPPQSRILLMQGLFNLASAIHSTKRFKLSSALPV